MNAGTDREEPGHDRHYLLFLVLCGIAVMTGCSTAPPVSTVKPALPDPGRIGITSPAVHPETDMAGLPPRGTAEGAIAGTAAGAVIGAFDCLIWLYPFAPAYPICMAVLATAGTGAGIVTAEPGEIVDAAQEQFTGILTERDWQALLRQEIVQQAARQYRINANDLGAPRLLAEKTDTAADMQGSVQSQQAETGRISLAASAKLTTQADTIMEVALLKLTTWFSGDHKFGFVLTGQAQLIRNPDLVVFSSSTHYYVSPSLPLPEWIDRDGVLIRETVTAGVEYLAQEMVREQLLLP